MDMKRSCVQYTEEFANYSTLMQAGSTKPFTIRTDASDYALGAVLLQGEGPNEDVNCKPIPCRVPFVPEQKRVPSVR